MTSITYYGHSTFLIEAGEAKILFDPFISPNSKASHIMVDKIQCNYICLSHGHNDHIEDLFSIAKRNNSKVIANFEICEWLKKKEVTNTIEINIGGRINIGPVSLQMLYALHSSSLPDSTYGGTAAGYLIKHENNTLYYAGDTALHSDMKLLGEFENVNLAFLPIGGTYTMDAKDATRAAKLTGCKKIIGMHYDSFPSIEIDHDNCKRLFREEKLELILMKIGDKIII